MKIATFNVNGIKTRLPNLLQWLAREQPDVACLQELKALDEPFPHRELPGDPRDDHSRYIEAAVDGVIIACLYLPKGNPQPGPKFASATSGC